MVAGYLAMAVSLASAGSPDGKEGAGEAVVGNAYRVRFNIAYVENGDPLQVCDIYLPENPVEENPANKTSTSQTPSSSAATPPQLSPGKQSRPLVLLLHGGAWRSGDKWTMSQFAMPLARNGCVVMNANYRLAPKDVFPAQIDDVRSALLFAEENADKWRIDLRRVGIAGYSAGGHLAVMQAVLNDADATLTQETSNWPIDDARWKRLPKVSAVVGGATPCDLRDMPPNNTMLSGFLGGTLAESPAAYASASPARFATAGDLPILFLHGDSDGLVPDTHARSLHRRHLKLGIDSRFVSILGRGHLLTMIDPRFKTELVKYLSEKLRCGGNVANNGR
ncbi:MAG: alpha/beta hydrolase [Planctomycetota bacterium]